MLDREVVVEDNHAGSKMVYFLTGIGIGALIGVLFAPKSGRETREYIAHRAEEGRDYLMREGRRLREQATDYVERGKGAFSEQREHLAAAIEAGKQAYRAESKSKAD
jgi:gas vesicle protein